VTVFVVTVVASNCAEKVSTGTNVRDTAVAPLVGVLLVRVSSEVAHATMMSLMSLAATVPLPPLTEHV